MASISVLMLFPLSMVYTDSFAIAVTQVCMDKFAVLHCPVQGPFVWKYKDGENWRDIGYSSKNETYLSPNVPYKLKNVTNIFPNGSLVFLSFASELSGVYKCEWKQIYHRPHIVVAVNCGEKTICEGDGATIECDLLQYKKLIPGLSHFAELDWKVAKENLISMGHDMKLTYQNPKYPNITASQGALRIKSVSKDMDGQRYTCVIHGQSGVTKRQYSVIIKVQKCRKKIEACEGERVDLECPYYQLLTRTKSTRLNWYKGSTIIATLVGGQSHAKSSKSPLVKVNGTMVTLVSPGIVDSGTYRCMVFRDALLLAEHGLTVNVTQCFKPTGYRNSSSMEVSPAPKRETKADGGSARAEILSVFFAVLVVSVLI